jgi:hypothetical protein
VRKRSQDCRQITDEVVPTDCLDEPGSRLVGAGPVIEVLVSSVSMAVVAICGLLGYRMRLTFLREQLMRAPAPTYGEVTALAEAVTTGTAATVKKSVAAVRRPRTIGGTTS